MISGAEVTAKIEALWPDAAERALVRAELDRYGVESHEREPDRVRLAILKLSEGRSDKIVDLVRAAKRDYRDVLMWAEYPGEGQALWALRRDLSDEERRRLDALRQEDRRQYERWRKK